MGSQSEPEKTPVESYKSNSAFPVEDTCDVELADSLGWDWMGSTCLFIKQQFPGEDTWDTWILGMRSLLTLCPAMKIRRRARLAEARKMCTLHLTMCAEHSTMCTVHCRKQSTSCAYKQYCTAWKVYVVQVYFKHSHLSVINRLLLQVQKLASPSSYFLAYID